MAATLAQNVHRRNRRKLGRGQYPSTGTFPVVVTSTGTTNMRLTYGVPVVVSGPITSTVATRTLISQTVVSPTVVDQVWSGNVAALAYTVAANDNDVRSYTGGTSSGAAGTFP